MPVNKDDEDVISAYAGQRIDINYAIAIHLRRSEFIANLILWGHQEQDEESMRIALIQDHDVLKCLGKMSDGEPTYYVRNLLSYTYKGIDTPSVLRKLKDMEKRGLVKRVRSEFFLNNISWTLK